MTRYDDWKALEPPYYTLYCPHEHYEVELEFGRARCVMCGYTWPASEDDQQYEFIRRWVIKNELRKQIRREKRKAFWAWVRRGFRPETEPELPF